jgi:ParB family chromosome partitioning protein
MSGFYSNAIFWVEVDKIQPNPYQPRKEFDEARLQDLAGSIRQYGVLQPLVVSRREFSKEDGGIGVVYELIAGERRLRASKIAGLPQVPVIIRDDDQSDMMKLELAIIENLQREDLNAIDRARAFERLANEFNFKHADIAKKVGKSREYVSNTIRLLMMPEVMQTALSEGRITEGHTRPLLMLIDRPEEQDVLFREIMLKKLTVREAEGIARRIAFDKVRKFSKMYDPDIVAMEQHLTEALGTRVAIETKEVGGKLVIDFFSDDDLRSILGMFSERTGQVRKGALVAGVQGADGITNAISSLEGDSTPPESGALASLAPIDDVPRAEISEDEFDPKSFSI